jgi:hypothetical protein
MPVSGFARERPSPSARIARQVLSFEQEGAAVRARQVRLETKTGAFYGQEALRNSVFGLKLAAYSL